jgi:hypothetical protein
MALTIAQHIAELTARFPLVNDREATELFVRSHQKVVREHPWPFCIAEDRIVTEPEYSTGTVNVTTLSAAVAGVDTVWQVGWATAPSMRRIIIEGRPESYRVASIASATALTLRDVWVGDTGTDLAYRMYRDIYTLPSNCGYGGEYIIIDPPNNRAIKLKNYGTMVDRGLRNYGTSSDVTWASRVDLTATGIPQLQFDPPPSSLQVFPLLYFRGATKPASTAALPDPLFPADAEDLTWKRMLMEYAKDPRHKRADWRDFENEYEEAVFKATKDMDGGAELDVRLHNTYPTANYDSFSFTVGGGSLEVLGV